MTLTELLAELRENILHDRSNRTEGASDFLWSDATLIRYINEAQRRFARRGLILRDNTTAEVCRVTLATGVTEYTLNEAVLAVISAKLAGDVGDMVRVGHAALDAYRPPQTDIWDPATLAQLPAGKPLAYTTDEAVGLDDAGAHSAVVLRVYPEPSAAYNGTIINLRVCRLPLNALSADCPGAEPEIPEDHHLEMLDWAAYLALRIVDIDGGNPQRAQEFAQTFEAHVKEARRSAMRKMFAPIPWGFGRGGFVWES